MFKDPHPGDLLMDAPKTSSWWELLVFTIDKDYWMERTCKKVEAIADHICDMWKWWNLGFTINS